MKLTFGTHEEPDKVFVTECSTWKEMWDAIEKYLLDKYNRKADYTRLVELSDTRIMIDYGSWSRFFFVDISFEKLMKLREEDEQQHD